MAKIFGIDFRKGTLIDSVSNTAMTVTGTPVFKETEKGMALAMSTGQKLVLPSFTGLNSASKFTWIGWLKSRTNTTTNGNSFLDRTVNVNLRTEIVIGTDNNFYIFPSDSTNYAYFSTPDITNYHQYVVVYDGTQTGNTNRLKFYIDGVQKTLNFGGTIPSTIHASTANLNIGTGTYSTANINCNLNKTDLLNEARTQDQINKDYAKFLKSTNIKKPKSILKMKPNDLKESGLVAAYNMTLQNGVPNDISGNNIILTKTGVINSTTTGSLCTGNGYYNHTALSSISVTGTYSFQVTFNILSTNANYLSLIGNTNSTNDRNLLYIYHSIPRLETWNGSSYTAIIGTALSPGRHTITCVSVSNVKTLYVDGIVQSGTTVQSLSNGTNKFYIAGMTDGTYSLADTIIEEVKIYNRALTLAEAVKYNNRNVKTTLLEDFSNNGADGTSICPQGWQVRSGTWGINQTATTNGSIKAGTKYLQSLGTGIIRTLSSTAYGTWEFDFSTLSGANDMTIDFITTTGGPSAMFPVLTGYAMHFTYNATNITNISLTKVIVPGTTGTILIDSGAITKTKGTFCHIKITRTMAGLFTLLVDGALIGTATDNAYTTSYMFTQWTATGDRLTNIKITDGLPA